MSNTLVTGGTGFTGRALCRRLVAEGRRVVAFVRDSSDTGELESLGVDCRRLDLCDAGQVDRHFEEFETIFHLAAAYRTEHADREEFARVNVGATQHLLESARRFGVGRFVHCSTVGVQGEIHDAPADEEYRLAPGDHYQDSKRTGELLAREYFAQGLPGCVVRPVGIYGPGDRRFLKLFRPISRGRFVLIGDGSSLYHLTYIDDLVEGFWLAATAPGARGEVFTIAGPRYTTVRELVDLVAEVLDEPRPRLRVPLAPVKLAARLCEAVCAPLGVAPPLYPRRLDFFELDRAFTTQKAKRLLGYEPRVDLREGLSRTAEGYRAAGWI